MKNRINVIILLLLLSALRLPVVHAAITSVTVTPTGVSAVVGQNNHYLLTWRVGSTLISPIHSTQGQFIDPVSGAVLGVVNQLISGNTVAGTRPVPATLTEPLTIPAAVLQAVVTQHLARLLYVRSFTDDDGPTGAASGRVLVTVVIPAAISASASPAQFNASLQAGGHIVTTWNVATTGGANTVRSMMGEFLLTATGPVLQTVSRPLSGRVTGTTARLPETLPISPSIVYQVLAAKRRVFYYHRYFDAGLSTSGADAMVEIRIGGSSTGPLALARLALRFSDGSRRRLVGTNAPLYALAVINYTGAGLLQAVWEVATPPSTSGQAVYRPLRFVRQYLLPGGHVVLQSPPLPVAAEGRHVLRLRVQTPLLNSPPVALEYNVNPALHGTRKLLRPLLLRSPAGGAQLNASTRFAWQPVPATRAYQLEFYAVDMLPDAQPPQGGILVQASTSNLLLSALARAHLRSGRNYRWRVLAIGKNGKVLAESDLRELLVP